MSDKNFKVSVLVTFYNQVDCVDRSLKSIYDQVTNFDYEVLVGDDGSTDGTIEKINEWIDKYPDNSKLYVMSRRDEDNLSISSFRASRNRINLLKHVSGEYFVYLDGDDYYCDNDKLQMQVDMLEKPENQGCIACAHQFLCLEPDGRLHVDFNEDLQDGIVSAKDYWKKYYFHTNTLLTRSSVIPKLPLDILENNFNDWMITYPIIQHGDIYYISKPMAVYVRGNAGIWTGQKEVVSYIRYLFMVDFCNMIGPDFRKVSEYRLAEGYYKIFKLHKEIKKADLTIFRAEAEDKGCKEVLSWINYPGKNVFVKLGMLCRAAFLGRRITISRCIYNVHGWLYRTYHKFFKKKLFAK